MNIVIIGAAGFIGTNLAMKLKQERKNKIVLVDRHIEYFPAELKDTNIEMKEALLNCDDDFEYLKNQDVLYHLFSTTVPTTSNNHISQELLENVVFSSKLLEKCIQYDVKKVVFISSGGTVYGKEVRCPLPEETPLKPISSYGLQKVAIENLLYLYRNMHGLDYRIIRLSNPYGPYQRPNGVLGAVTTFTYKAMKKEKIEVYGDGSVVRDFIYIDDAIKGILSIANNEGSKRTYNLGSGKGISIKEVINTVQRIVGDTEVVYKPGRSVDVPVNFLDISRFERDFGKLECIDLDEGIKRTAEFLRRKG